MLKNLGIRRASAVIMVIMGVILMVFAPNLWAGVLVFFLGVILELLGAAIERKTK